MALAVTFFPLPMFLSAVPLMARLLDSVAPPVKMIQVSFSALINSATFFLASSIVLFASNPAEWREEGFPYLPLRYCSANFNTLGSMGIAEA